MPPVDESTFIAKADALIAALGLLAVRLDAVSIAIGEHKIASQLGSQGLAARVDEAIATYEGNASRMEQLEIGRIKSIPQRRRNDNGSL